MAKDWRTWMEETTDALSASKSSNKAPDWGGFQFSSLLEMPPEIASLSDKMATSLANYFRSEHPILTAIRFITFSSSNM